MTKMYVHYHVHKDLLAQCSNLYSYAHLTDHYFLNRNDGKYDRSHYDPAVFQRNYLDRPDRLRYRDKNHPHLYRDVVLNMEHHRVWQPNHPNWKQLCQEYINITRMTKAAGQEVSVYGISFGWAEFQIDWNLGRYSNWINNRPETRQKSVEKYREYQRKGELLEERAAIIADKFRNEIDNFILSCYAPYPFDEDNDWKMDAWKNYLRSTVDRARRHLPEKGISAFVQPQFVGKSGKWQPMSLSVWSQTLEYLYDLGVDRIYVFSLRDVEFAPGWEKPIFGLAE